MEEMKTRSIRASETVLEQFKVVSESFPNQSEALSALIGAWETQNAKAVLSGMETDISDFDAHLKAIQGAFLHILDLNANGEDRIRMEFKSLIESKDKTIIDLQSQLNTAEQRATEAEQRATEATAEAETVKKETTAEIALMRDKLTNAERAEAKTAEQLSDKNKIIDDLNRRVADQSKAIEQAKTAETRATEATARAVAAESKVKELEMELQAQIRTATAEAELAKAKAEADKEKAIAAVERTLNNDIKELNSEIKRLLQQHKRKKETTETAEETAENSDQLTFDNN